MMKKIRKMATDIVETILMVSKKIRNQKNIRRKTRKRRKKSVENNKKSLMMRTIWNLLTMIRN
jgi:hypothetical protein